MYGNCEFNGNYVPHFTKKSEIRAPPSPLRRRSAAYSSDGNDFYCEIELQELMNDGECRWNSSLGGGGNLTRWPEVELLRY